MFPIEVISNIYCQLSYRDSLKLLLTCKDYYNNEYIRDIRRNFIIQHHENLQQLFYTAVALNDIKMVKILLHNNLVDPNYLYTIVGSNCKYITGVSTIDKITALSLAIILANHKIVNILLNEDKRIEYQDVYINSKSEYDLCELFKILLNYHRLNFNYNIIIRYALSKSIRSDYSELFKILMTNDNIKSRYINIMTCKNFAVTSNWDTNKNILVKTASIGSIKILDVLLNTEEYKNYDVTQLFNIIPIKKIPHLTDYLYY
jgi:hypothetical protein